MDMLFVLISNTELAQILWSQSQWGDVIQSVFTGFLPYALSDHLPLS